MKRLYLEYGKTYEIPVTLESEKITQRRLHGVIYVKERTSYPAMLRMDNGPEFISIKLAEWAEKHGVKLEHIKPGKPTKNSFVDLVQPNLP